VYLLPLLMDIPEERVSVTHPRVSDPAGCRCSPANTRVDFKVFESSARMARISLYVGSRVNYKNLGGLLDAYSASPSLRTNFFCFSCFGGGRLYRRPKQAAINQQRGSKAASDYLGGFRLPWLACQLCPLIVIRLPVLLRGIRHTGTRGPCPLDCPCRLAATRA